MDIISRLINSISDFNTASVAVRLFMATLLGGIIGLDRGLKKRPAGIRTFALVSVGAAVAMITNEYLYRKFGTSGDIARMAAQVISGVGFLGAGTIIVTGRQRVKGLTTAASLWATAAMGIAVGSGFFMGAILGFICIMLAMTILHRMDELLNHDSRLISLYVEVSLDGTIPKLLDYIHKNEYFVSSFEKNNNTIKENDIILFIDLDLKKRVHHSRVVSEIALIEGVYLVEEVK